MTPKPVTTFLQSPLGWVQGFYQNSFIDIIRSQTFTYPVSQAFLTSKSMQLVNPRGHEVKMDRVSMKISALSIKGMSDEEVLSRLVKGFFGGPIFFLERTAMCWGTHKWLPPRFSKFERSPNERLIWRASEIPKSNFVAIGDIIFGAFKMTDCHLQDPSDLNSSYVDFCFGSDESRFGGCHRFVIVRVPSAELKEAEDSMEEQVEVLLEHFRCNPKVDVDSWAEYIPWFHYWYAKVLFADAVRNLLGR